MYQAELDLLHIHIPKTAGTSLKRLLFGKDAETRHELASQFSTDLWDTALTFAVVRNPYDRMVSSYVYHVHSGYRGVLTKQHEDLSTLSFAEYLERFCLPKERRGHLFASQVEYMTHAESPKDIDFVANFESLDTDFARLAEKLGIDKTLPHALKGKRSSYHDYYGDHERQLVEHAYSDDVEQLGYDFK